MNTQRLALLFLLLCGTAHSAQEGLEQCLLKQFQEADDNVTMKEIRERCAIENNAEEAKEIEIEIERTSLEAEPNIGVISNRKYKEERTQFDPYVITPHNMNYILPAYTTSQINVDEYTSFDGYGENLENIETKFQLSLKVPLNSEDILFEDDALFVGFTLEAWWQVYSDNISKPFRESNYKPEIFYFTPMNWNPFGGNTAMVLGLEHQSNGRAQVLSRSWNRFYTQFLFEKDNFALSFKPWARLQEDEKEFEFDPDGDDNPDIDDFMGHFELGMVYKWKVLEFSFEGRQNFATHNGAAEFGITFPLWGKLRGYSKFFHGYGDSLIDYDHKQTRFGLGIALNDVL